MARRFADWPGDIGPRDAALPMRIAGGLHALVLMGRDTDLAAVYPPHRVDGATLLAAVIAALHRHDGFLLDWVQSPPQTNEVRRSAGLIASAHWLDARFRLPLHLSERGASVDLNLCAPMLRGISATGSITLSPGNISRLRAKPGVGR